jgi:L-histidine N-alpha-methyltransferase
VPALSRITGRKLVLYIGSSIGNFEPPHAIRMLRRIRQTLRSGDALLLGADYAKSSKILVPAYDDAQGVTACLQQEHSRPPEPRTRRRLQPRCLRHIALWNRRCSRMEIYLESTTNADRISARPRSRREVHRGERMHTENSYKYTDAMIESILRESGFMLENTWCDRKKWFGLHLARV